MALTYDALTQPVGPPNLPLYHFTSCVGLMGILSSRKIWASAVEFLNDSKELKLGFGLLSESAAKKRLTAAPSEHVVLDEIVTWCQGRQGGHSNVFVASFSLRGDLLSQWRGYTPVEGGLSLGFDPRELEPAAAAQGFTLARCIYDPEKQQDMVDSLLNEIIESSQNELATGRPISELRSFLSSAHSPNVASKFATFKSLLFQEEDEFRLIKVLGHTLPELATVKYRATASTIVPYLEFNLPLAKDGRLSIAACIYGPGKDVELTKQSVPRLMRSLGVDCLYNYYSRTTLVR